MLLKCILDSKVQKVLNEYYEGFYGGNYAIKATAHKIMRARFYLPSLFNILYDFIKKYHECKVFYGKHKLSIMPLKSVVIDAPFAQWGLDLIGEINPHSYIGQVCIITAKNYFTK